MSKGSNLSLEFGLKKCHVMSLETDYWVSRHRYQLIIYEGLVNLYQPSVLNVSRNIYLGHIIKQRAPPIPCHRKKKLSFHVTLLTVLNPNLPPQPSATGSQKLPPICSFSDHQEHSSISRPASSPPHTPESRIQFSQAYPRLPSACFQNSLHHR